MQLIMIDVTPGDVTPGEAHSCGTLFNDFLIVYYQKDDAVLWGGGLEFSNKEIHCQARFSPLKSLSQ